MNFVLKVGKMKTLEKKVNNFGGKTRQRDDREDRLIDYRLWKYKLNKLYTTDVDQIEWRIIDGQMKPVAVLEMTRIDDDNIPGPNYFKAIINRFETRDTQKYTITHVANRLNVDVYIVAFLKNLSYYMVYNLSKGDKWEKYNEYQYINWLQKLGQQSDPFDF